MQLESTDALGEETMEAMDRSVKPFFFEMVTKVPTFCEEEDDDDVQT
jgi:hypothetical protein